MLSGSGSSSSPSADIPEFGLLKHPGPRLNTFTTSGIGHPHQEARDISESILVAFQKHPWTLGTGVNALSGKTAWRVESDFLAIPCGTFDEGTVRCEGD